VALALAGVTVVFVTLGLFPRLIAGSNRGKSLFYFGGVAQYRSAADYEAAVYKLDDAGLRSELSRQAWEVAVIAMTKHRWAKRAYLVVLAFLVTWAVAMLGFRFS
jgi:hypothetical protein